MYIPSSYRIDAPEKIHAFIHAHGFASFITHTKDGVFASHLPVLLDEREGVQGQLRSHMARANPQWQHFVSGEEALCIFHGPHSYISPSWYVMQHTVPTWNYAAVHVYGRPEIVDRAALKQIVLDTTAQYESGMPAPWTISLSESEIDGMCNAIVGFVIEITRVEAKFKFGQNRSSEDQQSMLKALQASPHAGSRSLAELILQQGDSGAKESVAK